MLSLRVVAASLLLTSGASTACGERARDERFVFGELPYPLPTEGSLSQSVAMKRRGGGSDPLLEDGCITYAHVLCEATAVVRDVTFWRYCLDEGMWRELPDDAYAFNGTLCNFEATINDRPAIVRCIGGACEDDDTCWVVSSEIGGLTEEGSCGSHANGTAAGGGCKFRGDC